MTGRKSFATLTSGFTPDQREQVDAAGGASPADVAGRAIRRRAS